MSRIGNWYREYRREGAFLREHWAEYWPDIKIFALWYGLACVALCMELMFILHAWELSGIRLYGFLITSVLIFAGIGTIIFISIKGARMVQTELKQKYNYYHA